MHSALEPVAAQAVEPTRKQDLSVSSQSKLAKIGVGARVGERRLGVTTDARDVRQSNPHHFN